MELNFQINNHLSKDDHALRLITQYERKLTFDSMFWYFKSMKLLMMFSHVSLVPATEKNVCANMIDYLQNKAKTTSLKQSSFILFYTFQVVNCCQISVGCPSPLPWGVTLIGALTLQATPLIGSLLH